MGAPNKKQFCSPERETAISLPDGKHTFIDYKFPVANIQGAPNAVGGIAIDIAKNR
jgi:DNA anti-recombination protein RmuC